MANKNAEAALIVLIVLIIIVILYAIIVNAIKDCRSDQQCGPDRYCGSDFKCHEMKIVHKEITLNEYHLGKASLILGACIIIAAVILKWKKNITK